MTRPGGHHVGLPAACPCSTWPPNQASATAIPTFGCLFPLHLVSLNSLVLAPNHFYRGAYSQYLSWATKTGQGMRWLGLCVPAVGRGETGQYDGNTACGVEVDVHAASDG